MTDVPPNNPPPTLDYATPRRTDRFGNSLDVEEMILAGAGPREIRRYFSGSWGAVQFFANVMGRHFGADRVGDRCVGCGAEARELAIRLGWRVDLRAGHFEFSLTGRPRSAILMTWHPICRMCACDWTQRLRWDTPRSWTIRFFGGILVLAGVGAIGAVMAHPLRGDVGLVVFAMLFFVSMYVVLRAGELLVAWALRQFRPTSLSTLMPDGVRFMRVGGVFHRNAAGLVDVSSPVKL